MNSEQLDQSLRSEFENYLKATLAQMRQEASDFQTSIEAEFEKQKAGLNEAFKAYSARFDSEHTFDEGFQGSVSEHLRLARDEGARITAEAMAEAEKLKVVEEPPPPPPPAKYDGIRDAVNDISSKDSQSAILKTLVQHVAEFAPRGAFFIIKNEHFAGWKVFGANTEDFEETVREIHFPVAADSILGHAVRSLAAVNGADGGHADDSKFLEPLSFGHPDRMHAIPLVARGRGVAVLYVDHGVDGDDINAEALETLVRVAGLTVELLASNQTAKAENRPVAAADFEQEGRQETTETAFEEANTTEMKVPTESLPVADDRPFAFSDSVSFQGGFPVEQPSFDPAPSPAAAESYSAFDAAPVEHAAEPEVEDMYATFEAPAYVEEKAPVTNDSYGVFDAPAPRDERPVFAREESPFDTPADKFEVIEEPAFEVSGGSEYTPFDSKPEPVIRQEESQGAMVFDTASPSSGGSIDLAPAAAPSPFAPTPFEPVVEQFEPAASVSGTGFPQMEPVMEAPIATPPPRARLSERPVDLPIEVAEDERRIHNDARRFARLLVSEIKLYNEKKVMEGREANDLYDRLREAIDRSREMYDKRVQPPVAAKFDYFHYELVNSLADGESSRLGSSYPGSTV